MMEEGVALLDGVGGGFAVVPELGELAGSEYPAAGVGGTIQADETAAMEAPTALENGALAAA